MPRNSRNPVILDDLLQVSVSFLLQEGDPDQIMILKWHNDQIEIASMTYRIVESVGFHSICFTYLYSGESKHVEIELVSKPSNLGRGQVHFFVCPITSKYCRKLYLFQGYLTSRLAIPGGLYDSQVWSKQYRRFNNTFGRIFQLQKLNEKLCSPHFKMEYRGKPTKSFLRLTSKIDNIYRGV